MQRIRSTPFFYVWRNYDSWGLASIVVSGVSWAESRRIAARGAQKALDRPADAVFPKELELLLLAVLAGYSGKFVEVDLLEGLELLVRVG